jgi:hypothetical protein
MQGDKIRFRPFAEGEGFVRFQPFQQRIRTGFIRHIFANQQHGGLRRFSSQTMWSVSSSGSMAGCGLFLSRRWVSGSEKI